VYGQWAHLQRYPEAHRPLACLLKQAQQKNLNKRKTSNNTGVDKKIKTPTVLTRFLDGALRAQCSFIIHKSQIRGCPYPKFGNTNLLPSCMERWGLSITKEINIVSNATYSSLRENRPSLTSLMKMEELNS